MHTVKNPRPEDVVFWNEIKPIAAARACQPSKQDFYFFSENHALWVCSETMALPVMVLSFLWRNGVVDDWSNDNHRYSYLSLYGPWEKRIGTSFLAFKTRSSISHRYSTTPLLQALFKGAPNKATSYGRGFFTTSPTGDHKGYGELIAVFDRHGQFLRVGGFRVNIDLNIVEQATFLVKKF